MVAVAEKTPVAGESSGNDFDVIIVGAGLSGVNSAYRVQTQTPNKTYTILEGRGRLGGTWDLFKYPGLRSDSDLQTFGFQWRPWPNKNSIATGATIRDYIEDCAKHEGIDKHINYHHLVKAADFSTKTQRWTLKVEADGQMTTFTANFIIWSSGYYDYNNPLKVDIPGIKNFKGQIVHPQWWPEDLDYAGKKVVIIGSGATAITLLPALAAKAGKVTMLQRSPSYIINMPGQDTFDWLIRWFLPLSVTYYLVRLKCLTLPFLFFKFCRTFPKLAKSIMYQATKRQLPKDIPWDPHFNPKYYPWEQRLCVCPDGDFFRALRQENTGVRTGIIKTVREHDILVEGQDSLDADIIVTATGLKIQLAGGAHFTVDGQAFDVGKKFMWNGTSIQDLPNAVLVIGYTNASWTTGADASGQMATRLINFMDKNGYGIVTPRTTPEEERDMAVRPTLNLDSTYIRAAASAMPKTGTQAPWLARSSYWTDMWNTKYGSVTKGMEYVRAGAKL